MSTDLHSFVCHSLLGQEIVVLCFFTRQCYLCMA